MASDVGTPIPAEAVVTTFIFAVGFATGVAVCFIAAATAIVMWMWLS